MSIEKAVIEWEKGSSTDAIECMFNPAELRFRRINRFGDAAAVSSYDPAEQEFRREESSEFDISLDFDTTEDGDPVTKYTEKIVDLMRPRDMSGEFRPPYARLIWAKLKTFWSVIETVDTRFTYFGADGTPLRAQLDVSFKQAFADADGWKLQNPTSHTPDPGGRHQVQLGETLDRIAAHHYGDATRWRDIAAANGISDPLALRPGRMLLIPKG